MHIRINRAAAFLTCREPLTVGMSKAVPITMDLSEDWAGLNKVAIFKAGTTQIDILDNQWPAANAVYIPPEVTAEAGVSVMFGLYGTNDENRVVLPTVWVALGRVQTAPDADGDPSTDPTLPVWAQLQGEMIESATVNDEGHLIITLHDGSEIDAGLVKGQDGTDGIFWATYGVTTSAEIEAAYQAGKFLLCKHTYNGMDFIYAFTRRQNSTIHDFGLCFWGNTAPTIRAVYCQNNSWHGYARDVAVLSSPAFTGTPTAPTADPGTDSTQIATTAFVQNAVSGAGSGGIFWATYGTTGSADIEAAYQSGKTVLVVQSGRVMALTYRESATKHYFGCLYRDVIISSSVCICDNGSWSGARRDLVKLNDFAAIFDSTQSYTAGTYIIHNGDLYIFTANHSGNWSDAHATRVMLTDEITALAASIPSASSVTPSDLGTASAGSATTYSRADHVHKMPSASDVGALPSTTTIPAAATADPADLGTKAKGSSTKYAREDHVHKMPSASDVGAYALPTGGIPATDLAASVQTSLGKADTALQSAPVTSVNSQTGAVSLAIPSSAADVGAIAAPSSPTVGDFLVYTSNGWAAQSLSVWNGGSY